MNSKLYCVAFTLTIMSNAVMAQNSEAWFNIAETSEFGWQAKTGSGQVAKVDGKKNAGYKYTYQILNKKTSRIEYSQAIVLFDACKKGYGYVFLNDMEDKYTGKVQFVRFGNSVNDILGTVACTGWDSETGKVSKQDSDNAWEFVSESKKDNSEYFLRKDSIRKRQYNGAPAISALMYFKDAKDKTFNYSESVISIADCKKGYGTLYYLAFDGVIQFKTNIASNGESLASSLADALCSKL